MNRKLYRSRKDKMIAGVAAGLGEYFDVDSTLIRILFVVSLFFGGFGILAYIILWIVVPEEPFPFTGSSQNEDTKKNESSDQSANETYQQTLREHRERRRNFAGVILIIIGVVFLANNYIPRIHFSDFVPLIIIAIGIAILVNIKR